MIVIFSFIFDLNLEDKQFCKVGRDNNSYRYISFINLYYIDHINSGPRHKYIEQNIFVDNIFLDSK